jgi:hypothetical protein
MMAVLGLECLLAFMAAFEVQDKIFLLQNRQQSGDHWHSLFPYFSQVHRSCRDTKVLDIVATLLGATASNTLLYLMHERLAKDHRTDTDAFRAFTASVAQAIANQKSLWDKYMQACEEMASQSAAELEQLPVLNEFIRRAGGPQLPVKDMKVVAKKILEEWTGKQGVKWEAMVDF